MSKAETLIINNGGKVKQLKYCSYHQSMIEVSYNKLYECIRWENEKIKSHGGEHILQREVARYGKNVNDYKYGGYTRKPITKWPKILKERDDEHGEF